MGELVLPDNGRVYLDANGFIYSIERIAPYQEMLVPLWQSAKNGQISIVTSELTLLEVLVKPLKAGNAALITAFDTILRHSPDVQMVPITQSILQEAARLRAVLGLKTPDALHAATAMLHSCSLLVTNDKSFRQVASLPTAILSEHLIA